MGRDTPVYNEKKNILEVPLIFSFIAYLLNPNYEKSVESNPTFRQYIFFFILPKYLQVSKYTALLNKFSFPKKEKKIISLSFGWRIYVMVESRILWSYWKLYIWNSELIFPSEKQNYSELT